jgi:hypothetical protein
MRLVSPRDSQFTTTTAAGTSETDTGDGTELQWEYDEERARMYVSFPDDQ